MKTPVKNTKKPLTKRQILNQKTELYILQSIEFEGFEVEKPITTDKEKLQFLYNTFISEYGYYITHLTPIHKAFERYIQGLPSCFNIYFYNHDILQLAESMGVITKDATDREQSKIIDNYFNWVTVNTFKAFKKYSITMI